MKLSSHGRGRRFEPYIPLCTFSASWSFSPVGADHRRKMKVTSHTNWDGSVKVLPLHLAWWSTTSFLSGLSIKHLAYMRSPVRPLTPLSTAALIGWVWQRKTSATKHGEYTWSVHIVPRWFRMIPGNALSAIPFLSNIVLFALKRYLLNRWSAPIATAYWTGIVSNNVRVLTQLIRKLSLCWI